MKPFLKLTFIIIPGIIGLYFAFKGLFSLRKDEINRSNNYFTVTVVCYLIAGFLAYFLYKKIKNKNSNLSAQGKTKELRKSQSTSISEAATKGCLQH